MSKLPSGILLHVGTFTVEGENVTGYFVECTRAEIMALETVPLYERVELRVVEETKP